jgi:uncharacterized iron-regulated protein
MKILILFLFVFLPVTGWSATLYYGLDVKINTQEKTITGTARLKAGANKKIGLSVRNLERLNVDGKAVTATAESISLTVQSGKDTVINYEVSFADTGSNFVDKDHVFLTEEWYPQPDILAEYALSVTLPRNFTATSEAEAVTVQEHGETKTFNFQFKHPLDALHLAASTRYVLKEDRYNNIAIEAYFFKEDAQLAESYMAQSKKYLQMYETMLAPYPYQRFAIVENILPTGDSMPTFTLMGNQVLHLPFIIKTSLGHEILHQWFGNSVYVDYAHGNWAEGLTNYLADQHYAALEHKDAAYRKQILLDYHAYVNANNAMPMADFQSRRNRAQSAIGYGKSAMLFHELRKRFGDKTFFAALQNFILENRFRKASWHDIQRSFEKVAGEKLYVEFGHWLTRKDIPRLSAKDAELRVEQGELKLNFTLWQEGEPYELRIPIVLDTGKGRNERFLEVMQAEENISLTLDEPPIEVVIDENYDLMRQLAPEEIPPVLGSIMGKEKLIMIASSWQRGKYELLMDALGVEDITYVSPDHVTFAQMKENSFVIAGYDNTLMDMLFGEQTVPEGGVHLNVLKNPYNGAERIMLLHVKSKAEAKAVQQKISHYGKYTELAFKDGKNIYKRIAETANGLPVFARVAARVIKPDQLATLDDILPKLAESRIIYVGEQHDRFAHHANQLQIIKKLHEAGYKLAVGMEMFQVPFQQTVDEYMAGDIDESTFLQKSEYYTRWKYDYNLYKPIIDYLKEQNIPLVALNVERDITRKVAREGIYSLTDEEGKQLPRGMDFSNEQYRGDLNEIFSMHGEQHAIRDFDYFLQAQTLWDEGMAESAQRFLAKNPERKLVVVAGNGHMRHKYGIPERLYRRNQEPYTVIVQDEEIGKGIGDYILLTTELKGKESPKLGVLIEEKEEGLVITGVSDKTPAGKAGLKKGDIIKEFSGRQITSLADLKIALFYSEMGNTYKIHVKRGDEMLEKEIELFRFGRFSPQFSPQKHGKR